MGLLVRPAGRTSWTDQLNRSLERTSWTDQLDRPAEWTSWTDQLDDQFFLFEALASSHIRRLMFQFVHCHSFRVRWRSCFFILKSNETLSVYWPLIYVGYNGYNLLIRYNIIIGQYESKQCKLRNFSEKERKIICQNLTFFTFW